MLWAANFFASWAYEDTFSFSLSVMWVSRTILPRLTSRLPVPDFSTMSFCWGVGSASANIARCSAFLTSKSFPRDACRVQTLEKKLEKMPKSMANKHESGKAFLNIQVKKNKYHQFATDILAAFVSWWFRVKVVLMRDLLLVPFSSKLGTHEIAECWQIKQLFLEIGSNKLKCRKSLRWSIISKPRDLLSQPISYPPGRWSNQGKSSSNGGNILVFGLPRVQDFALVLRRRNQRE